METIDVIKKYRQIGMIQIIPTIISILFLALALILVLNFANISTSPKIRQIIALGVTIALIFMLIFGFFSLLISSFHFLKSKSSNDIRLISKGMIYLNRGFTVLSIFSILLVLNSLYYFPK